MRTQLKDMFFNNQKLTAFFYTYIERLLYLHGEFQSTKNKIKKKKELSIMKLTFQGYFLPIYKDNSLCPLK